MKIVINRCWGGFGLSYKAHMLYAELSGFKLYAYDTSEEGLIQVVEEKSWLAYNEKLINNMDELYSEGYFYDKDLRRDDPILVQVVETLGEQANDNFSYLKVIEVPDDIEWEIEKYDGQEWIAETHRTWH